MKGVFSLLGFITTVFLVAGYLYKNNYRFAQDTAAPSEYLHEWEEPSSVARIDESQHFQSTGSPEVRSYASSSRRAPTSTPSPASSDSQVESWLEQHARIAVLEAVRSGVPAGVSLSLGIAQLESGYLHPSDDFIERVVMPLDQLKGSDKRMWSRYYKYSANSGKWFEGLRAQQHFDRYDLLRIFDTYDLARFDAETYLALQEEQAAPALEERAVVHRASFGSWGSGDRYQAEAYQPAQRRVDMEVNSDDARRNMAYAMNRLTDERLRERGQSMDFQPRAADASGAARRAAEALPVGQPQRYYDPGTFHEVLREVLALEAGYPSWQAYKSAEPAAARRAFARRSDPVSLGGKMEIVRKR